MDIQTMTTLQPVSTTSGCAAPVLITEIRLLAATPIIAPFKDQFQTLKKTYGGFTNKNDFAKRWLVTTNDCVCVQQGKLCQVVAGERCRYEHYGSR